MILIRVLNSGVSRCELICTCRRCAVATSRCYRVSLHWFSHFYSCIFLLLCSFLSSCSPFSNFLYIFLLFLQISTFYCFCCITNYFSPDSLVVSHHSTSQLVFSTHFSTLVNRYFSYLFTPFTLPHLFFQPWPSSFPLISSLRFQASSLHTFLPSYTLLLSLCTRVRSWRHFVLLVLKRECQLKGYQEFFS